MAADAHPAFQLLAAVLHRHTVPVLVVDAECRILLQYGAARRLMEGRSCLSERAVFRSLLPKGSQAELEAALLKYGASGGNRSATPRGIRVARAGSQRDWLLVIHPVNGGHPPPSLAPAFLIQFIGRVWPRDLPASAAVDLFGLTPAELAVVAGLSRGSSVVETASGLGVSPETVRSHLKHIFRKCEIVSQGELLALLTWLATFAGE